MPVAVVQFPTHGDDLSSATKVISQPQCSFHQLQFEEVVGAAVVGVENQSVGLFRFELQFEGPIQSGVPLAEGVEGVLRSI